jgi:hypothetical protein
MANTKAGRIPTYKEFSIVLAANQTRVLNVFGTTLTILGQSGVGEIRIDDGSPSNIRAGITFKMPASIDDQGRIVQERFSRVTFTETAGAGFNMTLAIADGDIYDARSVISGDTPVLNAAAPNDSLQVDLLAADPGLVALAAALGGNLATAISNQTAAINAALQASNSLRSRLTSLASTSYSRRNNEATEQTIVASGTNVNGIIVRHAHIAIEAVLAQYAYFGINDGATKIFLGRDENGAAVDGFPSIRDLFIPAGVNLVSRISGTGDAIGYIWYQVL